jgi:hypothetical protein
LKRTCSLLALAVLAFGTNVAAAPITVNCDRGESLGRAIALLPRGNPNRITVIGTCTEYVTIRGVDDLTVTSRSGATLAQPPGDAGPPPYSLKATLTIDASRSITIDGLNVLASPTDPNSVGVFVRGGSADVRLRNTAIEGGNQCVSITQNSHVSLAAVTGRDPSWAAVGVYDGSAVYIESSLFESSSGQGWREGIAAIKGVAIVHGTRIRNMQVGMDVRSGGIIDLSNHGDYSPAAGQSDVVVESPAGTNFNGITVGGGSSFTIDNVRLRITHPGQSWGGDTGGVKVSDASSFNAAGNLEVVGSYGQGIVVTNNSSANVPGATVTGTGHAGLVVINNSSANLDAGNIALTPITGSIAPDLFCDSTSLITGADKAPSSTRQCDHLVGGSTVPLP